MKNERRKLREGVRNVLAHVYWDVVSPPVFAEALWKKVVNRTLRPTEAATRAVLRHTYEETVRELEHARVQHFATVPAVSPPDTPPPEKRFRRQHSKHKPAVRNHDSKGVKR